MSNRTFLGKVGMTPKGEWNNSTTYERLDIVSYEGSSYIAIIQNRNSRPSEDNQDWMIGAKHGEFTEEQLEEFKEAVVAESKQEMDDYTSDKKDELDTYESAKELELNTYTTTKKSEIDTHTTSKINDYNSNAETKTTNFNDNATSKTNAYNQNAEDKTTTFNTNASTKQNTFDTNATQKTNTFNNNATSKTTDFNTNATSKKSDYDTNATAKLEAYNTNATEKTEAFDQNAEDKTADFDEHVQELEEAIPLLQQENKDLLNAGYKIYTETPAESVTLNKTSKNKFVKFGVAGNKKQTTYNGYQLIHQPSQDTTVEANGITFESNADGTYRIYGTATANRQLMVVIEDGVLRAASSTYYSSLEAGEYTLKIDTLNGSGTGFIIRDGISTLTPTYALEQHFTLEEASSSINIYKIISNGTEIDWTFKIQLEKGTTAHEWEPYVGGEPSPNPTYKQDIHAVGDNGIVNISKLNKNFFGGYTRAVTTAGITFNYIGDGTIDISGTATANAYSINPEQAISGHKYNTIPGGTYTISKDSTAYDVGIFELTDNNWNNLANLTGNNTFATITVNERKNIAIRIRVASGTTINTTAHVQIEKGTTVTEFKAHEEETFNMPCQKPMVDESDYFDWDNEKEVHGWEYYEFNGTENWNQGSTGCYLNLGSAQSRAYNIICSHFKKVNSSTLQGIYYGKSSNWSTMRLYINNSTLSSVAELKQFLAEQYANGTPVYGYREKVQSEELPFTEEQKAVAKQIKNSTSYYEQTNVFSTDEVSPIYDVTAVGDLNLVIDEIVAMQIALGGEINNG